MQGGGQKSARGEGTRSVVYCVVPRDLAPQLHEPLRRHFGDEPAIEVVIERRSGDRRRGSERRAAGEPYGRRRVIRASEGRRVTDRRAAVVDVEAWPLPRKARAFAGRIQFQERFEPTAQEAEDVDTARLVTRIQAGDRDGFGTLYMRYFDRVYSYLRVVMKDPHEAEDATQQVFMKILDALPRYELQSDRPFRGWLFVIVRNHAMTRLKNLDRSEPRSPEAIDRQREASEEPAPLPVLDWISDRELVMFVERLPLPQRQVLLMRYMFDLSSVQIAAALDRTPDDVRVLQHRALTVLRKRLAAVGREPTGGTERSRWKRRVAKAPVLRSRRFALSP